MKKQPKNRTNPIIVGKVRQALLYGKRNAKKKSQLVAETGVSERVLREVIHELSTVYNVPVGYSSSPKNGGYFIIETRDELLENLRDLNSRTKELQERSDAVMKAFIESKRKREEVIC
jgi:hypothetical protein